MSEFGVVICCCRFDYFLAKGCVASVRHALPDTPITIFVDDDVDVRPLARAFGAEVMNRQQVKDPWLRTTNTGWGLPKMTLFWESPYERTLYLDCDTIMWGDVVSRYLKNADGSWGDWDMVIDQGDSHTRPWTPTVGTEKWVRQEYFNPDLMETTYPEFSWRKYVDAYFCTGTFALRRGVFSVEEYRQVLETRAGIKGLFPVGEMGFLNFMIFRAMEQGRLKVRREPYELLCDYTNKDWLPGKYPLDRDGPAIQDPTNPRVLHFTEPKPLTTSYGFHQPFTYFRRQAAVRMGVPRAVVGPYLFAEETPWRTRVFYRRRLGRYHRRFVAPVLGAVRGRRASVAGG